MSQSNVGNAQTYEAGDQRNAPASEHNHATRFEEGKENSHQARDPKDERSIANRLAAAEESTTDGETAETKALKEDPTLPARMHGNKPSRGAEIDAEIQREEQEYLERKGKA